MGDVRDDLLDELWHQDVHPRKLIDIALLLHDANLVFELARVVGANLRAKTVLKWGHDAAAVGVVFGVGGCHDEHIERQSHLVPANLHIPLFHDVQHPDLYPFREIGELVQGENTAVRAGDHPVVDRQLIRQVATLGYTDRVHFADEIGDSDVRGGKLLAVTAVATEPLDGRGIALLIYFLLADGADRVEGIVVDLAALDNGHVLVEQVDQRPGDACLGLAPLAQEDDVLPGEDRVLNLGNDGILIANDAGKQLLTAADHANEVPAHLLIDGLDGVTGGSELTDGGCWYGHVALLSGWGGNKSAKDGSVHPRARRGGRLTAPCMPTG